MKHRLAIIGFGNVGVGFASILSQKRAELARDYGLEYHVVAVSDAIKGTLVDPSGIPLEELLALPGGRLDAHPRGRKDANAADVIRSCTATVVAEATYTDLKTGEPASSHVRAAFETGKHVITTNKGPVALHYAELTKMAAKAGVQFRYEGTVMSGTPCISFGQHNLAGCTITGLRGILNGTTNFILTEMGRGNAYADALKKAQELGYAEADPSGDVDGYDTQGKVLILSNLFMGGRLAIGDIQRKGITGISQDDVRKAESEGKRWKLIGSLKLDGGRVTGSVAPEALPLSDPLSGVSGATNAIQYETDLMGKVTLVGAGAGRTETGFALLHDLLEVDRAIR